MLNAASQAMFFVQNVLCYRATARQDHIGGVKLCATKLPDVGEFEIRAAPTGIALSTLITDGYLSPGFGSTTLTVKPGKIRHCNLLLGNWNFWWRPRVD